MPTKTVDHIDEVDDDEIFVEVTLNDGTLFGLCRNDIEWNPIPYDRESLATAQTALVEAPAVHAAFRERILDLDESLDEAYAKAEALSADVEDLRFRGKVKTRYGSPAIDRLGIELREFIDCLRDELGRASMDVHRLVRSRQADLNASIVWKARRDEALVILESSE